MLCELWCDSRVRLTTRFWCSSSRIQNFPFIDYCSKKRKQSQTLNNIKLFAFESGRINIGAGPCSNLRSSRRGSTFWSWRECSGTPVPFRLSIEQTSSSVIQARCWHRLGNFGIFERPWRQELSLFRTWSKLAKSIYQCWCSGDIRKVEPSPKRFSPCMFHRSRHLLFQTLHRSQWHHFQ